VTKVPFTHSLFESPRFGVGGYIFEELEPEDIQTVASFGFTGIEPYRGLTMRYVDRPHELKEILDSNCVAMVTCSNGGPGQECDFINPHSRQRSIDDHFAFARDFLTVFGCKHFKMNMGSRPPGGPTRDDIARLGDALTELGRRVAELGILLAPHPHIWGPVERPEEIIGLMEHSDPQYVYLTLDTAHVNLGGGDPVWFVERYWERIAALHWKDTKPSCRGYTGPTPTIEMHREEVLYKNLGSGGVDHERIWRIVQERGYRGWITLDLDPPRSDEPSVPEKIAINKRFLTDTLKVASL